MNKSGQAIRVLFTGSLILLSVSPYVTDAQTAPPGQKTPAASKPVSQTAPPAQSVLSVSDYLQQARQSHQGYQASKITSEGAALQREEAKLIYRPNLFTSFKYTDDQAPNVFFQYGKFVNTTVELGISQQSDFGLSGKLYYDYNQSQYFGLPPQFNVNGAFYQGRPTLELTQSLWRNFGGSETRAQSQVLEASARAKEHRESFLMQTILVEAESTYWRLALARETEDLAKAAVDRAVKIYDYTKNRVNLSLTDASDLYQAEAALKARKLDLKSASDEVRAASLAFNSSRGRDSFEVAESLEPLTPEFIDHVVVPKRVSMRHDVLSAEQQTLLTEASARLAKERNRPTLELFGTYAFNSLEMSQGDAFSKSWTQRPTQIIGLRLTAPLDYATARDAQRGYAEEERAASLNFTRKQFEQERDWKDLENRFGEIKERLKLALELEKTQKEKYDYERRRQMLGRSTLYQVLQFETDYNMATGLRIRQLAEFLQLYAQMKLYGELK